MCLLRHEQRCCLLIPRVSVIARLLGVQEHVCVHAAVVDLGAVGVPEELAALLEVGGPLHGFPVEVETLVVLGGPLQESASRVLEVDVLVLLGRGVDELGCEVVGGESEGLLLGPQLHLLARLDGRVHLPDADHLRVHLDGEGDAHLHLVVEQVPLPFLEEVGVHLVILQLGGELGVGLHLRGRHLGLGGGLVERLCLGLPELLRRIVVVHVQLSALTLVVLVGVRLGREHRDLGAGEPLHELGLVTSLHLREFILLVLMHLEQGL